MATELLDQLVDRAHEEEIQRFTALLLAENNDALRLLERLGETAQRRVGSQVELDIELPAPPERSPQLRLVLTGVARGLLVPAISMWRQVADFAHRRTDPTLEPANAIVVHAYAPAVRPRPSPRPPGWRSPGRRTCTWSRPTGRCCSDRRGLDERLSSAADELRRRGLESRPI